VTSVVGSVATHMNTWKTRGIIEIVNSFVRAYAER
jgi:hypothetical protein